MERIYCQECDSSKGPFHWEDCPDCGCPVPECRADCQWCLAVFHRPEVA